MVAKSINMTTNTYKPQIMAPRQMEAVAENPRQSNQVREIGITQLNRGYVVRVGCHTFAIETASGLIAKLNEYILDPQKTEDKWFKGDLF